MRVGLEQELMEPVIFHLIHLKCRYRLRSRSVNRETHKTGIIRYFMGS
jgi:hypothetical protein